MREILAVRLEDLSHTTMTLVKNISSLCCLSAQTVFISLSSSFNYYLSYNDKQNTVQTAAALASLSKKTKHVRKKKTNN